MVNTYTAMQLIDDLRKIPLDTEVCIFDVAKAVHYARADGSSEGLYVKFDVEAMDVTDNESGIEKTIAVLTFYNPDYSDGYVKT